MILGYTAGFIFLSAGKRVEILVCRKLRSHWPAKCAIWNCELMEKHEFREKKKIQISKYTHEWYFAKIKRKQFFFHI